MDIKTIYSQAAGLLRKSIKTQTPEPTPTEDPKEPPVDESKIINN